MNVLGLDFGSSSIKAALVRNGKLIGDVVRSAYPSRHMDVRVEIDPPVLLRAMAEAIKKLGAAAKRADIIGLDVMAPAWVAMDARGKALTPIVTHQDRRSVSQAEHILKLVGKRKLLSVAGNLPFPGGISSTTWLWFYQNQREAKFDLRALDLVGHLNTFIHRQLTGARVIDPSNASFTGVFDTVGQSGWDDDLCRSVHLPKHALPEVHSADEIVGHVTPAAARRFGLRAGTPVMTGIIDTSAAMYLAGAKAGQLLNVSGSTDVLGVCTGAPHPHEKLLTRALGVGKKWMSVATLAAAGSALNWAKDQFFSELSWTQFDQLQQKLCGRDASQTSVRFANYLAGDRASIAQRRASLDGLTLSTTRDDILLAMIDTLAKTSAARLDLLRETGAPMNHNVILSGGAGGPLHKILHRDWPGKWKFKSETEASVRGLAKLAELA
jgi:xylulokinase